ncbi:MAG: hypothetical protein ABL865_05305, partial [Candidatus Nitrotoga sp.]
SNSAHTGGYTIIEILTVVAIIGFLTAVVVARYRDFDSTTVLKNLAYEIALSVREAQVMTISSSNLGGGGGAPLAEGQNSYGISFTANNNSYVIFNDLDKLNDYDSSSELVKLIAITQGATITDLVEIRSGGATEYPITWATITFDRPHLDTTFVTSESESVPNNVVEVVLTVTSTRGGERLVHIARSGRISVE